MASFVSPGGCGANQAVVGNVLSVAWLLQVPLFPLTGAFSVYLSARGRTSNIARAALATAGLVLGGAAMIGLAYTTSARLAIVCCALLELDRRSDGPSSNRRRDRPIQPARHCARGVPRLRISRRNTRTADIRKNHRHDGARRYRLSRCLPHLRRFRYRGSSHRARPYAASRRRRTFGRSDQGYDHSGPAVQSLSSVTLQRRRSSRSHRVKIGPSSEMSEIRASEEHGGHRPQHRPWRRHQPAAERPQRTKSASRIATTYTSGSAGVNGLVSCRKGSFAGQGFTFTAICRYIDWVKSPERRNRQDGRSHGL
jgi:hypothetical protein